MKSVLLIDDDEMLRTAFSHALQSAGYRVLQASTGSEGLESARQNLPDVILTDVNMPGGTGKDLLHEIRLDPELCHRQVVMMTGDPASATPRSGMALGADDFLSKPVQMSDLLQCIHARMQRAETHRRVEDRMLAGLRSSLHSNLPHEFFTPLAGILGLAQVLISSPDAFSPEDLAEMHRDIERSALRLHRTLRNYLNIVELDHVGSQAPEKPTILSADRVVEHVSASVTAAVERYERASDLEVEIARIALRVAAEDVALIVEELTDNACKFSRKGSPIVVKLDASGLLTVADHGRGLTPEEVTTIGAFNQFGRRKNEQQGLGLGLVLVQKLCARSGTKFSLESTPSAGTTVKIQFVIS